MPSKAQQTPEFTLPDRLRELIPEEERLRLEFKEVEARYARLKTMLPSGVSAMMSPLFFTLLVAHRKWQFAYEKRKRLSSVKV